MQNRFRKANQIRMMAVDTILPGAYQPRRIFGDAQLDELAQSIREHGVIQPLSVRRLPNGRYEVLAGERRLRAAKLAGLEKVPCVELRVSDESAALISLVENIQRSDLHFFEEAEGISRLMEEWEMTQQQVADRLGKSQPSVANKLRLLRLTPMQREKILDAGLTERHARALLRIDDWRMRDRALDHIIELHLNVADTEAYLNRIQQPKPHSFSKNTVIVKDVRLFLNTMTRALDTMRRSGIAVEESKGETDQFIEYTVRIPKKTSAMECSA
ncbi:MAG: ParB/RepB/Spo0J family partition protein [Clostridiales bacterium]|nr:ParB/RepB/Spo0J family partition protein [Clostridiales bacterium]